SDLYSLGVLLHYALRGELPHGRGQNPATTMESILQDAPPALPEGTPPAARRAIARLMAKEREDRPQSGRAAVELLGEALEHLDDPEWAPA
ncbi:MAG TPA: serine/threonine protein kinase, partial [Planctomycetes bacterium]|nr:serine/threonine protein kinase [Planctomycetota bacterium]